MTHVARMGGAHLRRLLEDHGVVPSKARGQNFVTDANTIDRIVRIAAIEPTERVVEIGAGAGSLTVALAAGGNEVIAVEIDHRLVELLRTTVPPNVRIVQADALALDWDELLGRVDDEHPVVLVANLPYNIATPLIVEILRGAPTIRRMLVMVQREVGERFAASPGGRDYGAVSVRVAYHATAKLQGRVSPGVFYPRPRVESALVAITRRPAPAVDPSVASYAEIDRVLRAGFQGRRKMLRRSLAGIVGPEGFEAAAVDPTARAEELDVEAWGRLAATAR